VPSALWLWMRRVPPATGMCGRAESNPAKQRAVVANQFQRAFTQFVQATRNIR
jgi:hypothetical protein